MPLAEADIKRMKDYNNNGFCECPNGFDWYCIHYKMKDGKYNCEYLGLGYTCDYEEKGDKNDSKER